MLNYYIYSVVYFFLISICNIGGGGVNNSNRWSQLATKTLSHNGERSFYLWSREQYKWAICWSTALGKYNVSALLACIICDYWLDRVIYEKTKIVSSLCAGEGLSSCLGPKGTKDTWKVEAPKVGLLGTMKVWIFSVQGNEENMNLVPPAPPAGSAAAFLVLDCTESGIWSIHMIVNTVLQHAFLVLMLSWLLLKMHNFKMDIQFLWIKM